VLANVLLIRWVGGWTEVVDSASVTARGRIEATLSLGAVQSLEEAHRIGVEQLAIYATERTQVTAGIEPAGTADTPYRAYTVGDTVTAPNAAGSGVAQRVVAITVAEDEDGYVTYAPELNDLIVGAEERLTERIRKLSTGTAGMG
jgi:hypothetical protein